MVAVGTATTSCPTTMVSEPTSPTSVLRSATSSSYFRTRRPRHYGLVARVLRRRGGWLRAVRTRCSLRATPYQLSALFTRRTSVTPSTFAWSYLNSMVSAPRLLSMTYPDDVSDLRTGAAPSALSTTLSPTDYPIVIDTGASISVSPNLSDFVDGVSEAHVQDLKGLNHTTKVCGMGMVEWTVYDVRDSIRTIRTMVFYVPDATIRLFSPQTYFHEGGETGHLHCDKDRAVLRLNDEFELIFPYNFETNLPFMLPATHMSMKSCACPKREKATVGLTYEDVTLFSDPDALMGLMTVADEANQNLTATQKELLQWHWKLGHCNFQ